MSAPTIELVYAAIDALYHTQQTDKASRWLDEFQHSNHAWDIANQVLKANCDPESTYLAAQTMKTKIQYHFLELPVEQHLGLRYSLIEHLLQYSLASHVTLTQLCLALADLAIQCPQWKSPVSHLVQKFSTKLEHFSILLEVLMILPEEVQSEILCIGLNRRNEVIENFKETANIVFNLLTKCHEVCLADDRTQCKLYQCFGSWFTLRCFPANEVANSQLLKLTFETLLKESITSQLHNAVTDCVCNLLYTCSDLHNRMPLEEASFAFVSSMLPPAFDKAAKEQDMDRAINYSRIFTEMGEAFLECILVTPGPRNLKIIDLILSTACYSKYEVVEIQFNFWYRLAEYIDANTPPDANAPRHVFKPYVEKLILLLCEHCQFEADTQGVPDKDMLRIAIKLILKQSLRQKYVVNNKVWRKV